VSFGMDHFSSLLSVPIQNRDTLSYILRFLGNALSSVCRFVPTSPSLIILRSELLSGFFFLFFFSFNISVLSNA
jgi:hypothetical protein